MRKLNLSLDHLVVESFVADDLAPLRGTVQGHNSYEPASCATYYCGTCQHDTCQYTENPCATYGETVCAGTVCTSVSDTPTAHTCAGHDTCYPAKGCAPPE
jgi:hypothetical protein